MFSSEDEQDDNHVFDKLKSIRPFTIDQLYSIHPDVGCPPLPSTAQQDNNKSERLSNHDNEIFQHLIEYEQLKCRLSELKSSVKKTYKKTHDHIDKAWIFKEESIRKVAMCQQGKTAETIFKYKQAFVSSKHLDAFSLGYSQLLEIIYKDFIYYSFESQMKRYKIAKKLSLAYHLDDLEMRRLKLKSTLETLINFIKHLGDTKSDFVHQCRRWFRTLARRLLEESTTDNYRFVIAQLARGPVGTAEWSSDLIECKPFEQVSEFDSVPQYINHCSALLIELFGSLTSRIEKVTLAETETASVEKSENGIEAQTVTTIGDKNWSLVDPRFACTEELNISSSFGYLSEADVIRFCLKIPVVQIFRSYVEKCLAKDDAQFYPETESYLNIMLKLLTIGTVIIKTYQFGLEIFNSIIYGNLIEYLSSQIRRTVIILSDKWGEFKNRLKGDDAILMRLQVEYDNFMLRSILIILELRQSGIWRHLSSFEPDEAGSIGCGANGRELEESPQVWSTESIRPAFVKLFQVAGLSSQSSQVEREEPANCRKQNRRRSSNSLTYEFSVEWFREVSEPMLWHILWQFYHNAFVSSCDYNSDNYWLDKFKENSVVYLFVNKIKDSPPGECSYLLNSITSMLLSRSRHNSKMIDFIATEIFNLSYKQKQLRSKVTVKGTRSLIRCAEKFPQLISLYLQLMSEIDCTESDDSIEDVIDLVKGCSLKGWICSQEELGLLADWMKFPINSPHSKISRIIITKILLNGLELRDEVTALSPARICRRASSVSSVPTASTGGKILRHSSNCLVDLKMRRKLALLLNEASMKHRPEDSEFSPQSLGTSVEVAFGGLYCEQNATMYNNMIELAMDPTYQRFYIWAWRLLFTLRLHILNQPETDWNDLKSRSGTSRSARNTVLINDSFYPVPSIQDAECLTLSEGVERRDPMASFVYMMLTDCTWQVETFQDCLIHLNVLVDSGHITPSLMAMKFLTICHLNDLSDIAIKDKKCLDYFTTLLSSNLDATRLASLIMVQLDHLKQYRQLQLSQFYVRILLDVANIISRQSSASWFSSNELSLEKIACMLDYLVKFNFTTQRMEIIHKFYDCAYLMKDGSHHSTTGWFGSFFASNPLNTDTTKREFLTNLHALSHKFKKYSWLRWITTECDTLRLEKIWEDIVGFMSSNENANLDSAIKRVCPHINASILKTILPIYSWIRQIFEIVETDLNHPLCPLIWYNFFLNFFTNSLNGTSVGCKLVQPETITKLMSRLDALFNYHLYKQRNWSGSGVQQKSLAHLYRAYRFWLQDLSLRAAYVDMDKIREEYLVSMLKAVMESSSGSDACLHYIDLQSIGTQNKNLTQVWLTATLLVEDHMMKNVIFIDNNAEESMEILTNIQDEASDATSLIVRQNQKDTNSLDATPQKCSPMSFGEDELSRPLGEDIFGKEKYQTLDELLDLIKRNFNFVFEEANIFNSNVNELYRTKTEIIELAQTLYKNKKRDIVRVTPCSDGNECIGPARIKFEIEEAMMDERKNHCIQDRRRQCQDLVGELLLMPKNRSINSTVIIEDSTRKLIKDPTRSQQTIEILLSWISEPAKFKHLSGNYHVASHLLKTCLEILSTSDQVDTFSTALIHVCLKHPEAVQIFSPHLTPGECSDECFLNLYKMIAESEQSEIGPMATFVLLSKFDLNSRLDKIKHKKRVHHDLIKATCSALENIGKDPDESFELAMDLFRRHLQVELALPDRRRPEALMLVLNEFLLSMSKQLLAPKLWVDYLSIFGLETSGRKLTRATVAKTPSSPSRNQNSSLTCDQLSLLNETVVSKALNSPVGKTLDETTLSSVVEDVSKLAENQTIFDYQSLDSMIRIVSKHMKEHNDSSSITLLELYSDYLDEYSTFMLSMTFMWIRATSERYPDNHELIWDQFMGLWYDWVFLNKNCQNVGKSSYCLMATYLVASIRFMIQKIPDNSQKVLRSILSTLTSYVSSTREVVYLELSILQRSLKNLPWSNLLATIEDFENLCALCEQENYNVSDLVSHIIMQIDSKKIFNTIAEQNPSLIPRVSERLATTIIMQSTHLKGYRLHGINFGSIPMDQIDRLTNLVLQKMEFVNLEHNQNNKLLVNLLRFTCIKLDTASVTVAQSLEDTHRRSLFYARFVSNYLIDLIKAHPTVTKYNRAYLAAVLDNSLQDLKPLLLSSELNLTQKTIIYEGIMECCSDESLEVDQRQLLSQLILESNLLKNKPLVSLEILHAIGQVIHDSRVLVQAVEELIVLYLNMNGHYEKVWKSFCLKKLPSDIYLNACIELKSPLALLVYFESVAHGQRENDSEIGELMPKIEDESEKMMNRSVGSSSLSSETCRVWSNFFHWLAQMTSNISDRDGPSVFIETKLATVLTRTLELFGPNLQQFVYGDLRSKNSVNESENTGSDINDDRPNIADARKLVETDENLIKTPSAKQTKRQQAADLAAKLQAHHRCLLDLIKQLIALYDSLNSGGIWSYLTTLSTKDEHSTKLSITALAIASFLVDKTLISLASLSERETPEHLLALRREMSNYRRVCLSKLEAARKSKTFLSYIQFVETLIECIKSNDNRVQYMEGVQLITTYVRHSFSPSAEIDVDVSQTLNDSTALEAASNARSLNDSRIAACLSKILPTL